MDKDILTQIYQKEEYLEYLRYHPKWYYYLDSNRNNFKNFEAIVKKEYRITTYDKLDKLKTNIGFVSSLINYFTKN